MKIDIKALIFLALLAGAALGFFLIPNSAGLMAAPNIQFKTIDGEGISLDALKGKPYLVTFWATDCPGCIEEIPDLVKLNQELSAKGFKIIAVAMSYDDINAIRTMRERKEMIFDVAYDQDGTISQAFGGIKVTPTNFLVSPEGNIVLQKLGKIDRENIYQQVSKMIEG